MKITKSAVKKQPAPKPEVEEAAPPPVVVEAAPKPQMLNRPRHLSIKS